MRQRRAHPLRLIGFLAALALGAAACSSTSSPAKASSSATSTTASPAAATNATVKVADNATFGKILVNSAGLALYTYGPDHGHGGQATCTGGCLQAWPALITTAGTTPTAGSGVTGTLAAVKQADGKYQVTYNGSPLYTFVQDTSAGQVTGNGVMNFSVATVGSGASGSGSSPTTSNGSGGAGGY